MASHGQFAPNSLVFVPDSVEAYALKTVVSCSGFGSSASLVVAAQAGGGGSTVPKELVEQVVEADPLALQGADDMVKFSNLTEAALLHNLRVRYSRDDIYSAAGSILISVNPFKQIPIFTEEAMRRCKEADAKALQDLPPHVYVIAESAYRGMLNEQKQQSILISGESGAGKTEAVKACLRHIVARSNAAVQENANLGGGGSIETSKFVEECIMQANPLLEAFGNAKTLRNGNSSRFGKWIEIHFDASGFITSSRITSYLLEKSRVVEHLEGERTYHAFYQMCRGSTAEQQQKLRLLPLDEFRYFGASAALKVPGIDDPRQWADTTNAMALFKLSCGEQHEVSQLLAAILHTGNLQFDAVRHDQQDDGSTVRASSQASLDAAAHLLSVAPDGLLKALTVKSVGKFPVVEVPQPPSRAAASCDALSRMVYGKLFEWLLSRINAVAAVSSLHSADNKRVVGLLDIFGFEAFERNSLEQLLINFANEKLQAHFNEYIFRLEEAECRAEGVACPTLEFADNSAVVEAMTSKPTGLLSLINEEVIVPQSSDASLLSKMQTQHSKSTIFKMLPRAKGEGFVITHFAGPVSYLIDSFVDKNRDALPGELALLLGTSALPLLASLFKSSDEASAKASGGAPRAHGGGGARGRSGGGGGKRNSALAAQFQESLDALMALLGGTSPHFVRCVKPNAQLVAERYDAMYVMRQLREMGMVHVVRARKQGYSHRYAFGRFNERYGYLRDGLRPAAEVYAQVLQQHLGTPNPPAGERTAAVQLLAAMVASSLLDNGGWAVGTGKVFMKAHLQQQLEVARESYLRRVVLEQLEKAIAAREVEALEKAIAAAIEVRLQSPLVAQAEQVLKQLQAQLAAAASLQEAMLTRDIPRLEAALAVARQVGLAGEALAPATQLLGQLRAQQEVAAALAAALQRNDMATLGEALAQASRVGLRTGIVQEAQRRYEGLQRKDRLLQELAEASDAVHLQRLTQLLQQAAEIGLEGDVVRTAQQKHAALQEVAVVQANLLHAVTSADVAAVRELVARAKASSTHTPELAHAIREGEQMIAHSDAHAKATAAQAEAAARAAAPPAGAAASGRRSGSDDKIPEPTPPAEASGEWLASPTASIACEPLAARVARLQNGCTLFKVADGKMTRHRVAMKHVQLTQDSSCLTWDGGKKLLNISTVMRVSIGLESRTLQKLYASSAGAEAEVLPYHWFSLHTASRSFDFGAKECGDESETLLLWVLTLQELLAPLLPPSSALAACSALSHAQTQWQRFTSPHKEWPCFVCTVVNTPNSPGTCGTCGSPQPLVTLNPCLMPLLPDLHALSRTLNVATFDAHSHDAHLLWFLLRVLESPLPRPFVWASRHKGDHQMYLGLATPEEGSFFSTDHPFLLEQQDVVRSLRAQVAAAGPGYEPSPPNSVFVSPQGDALSPSFSDSAPDTERSADSPGFRVPDGMSQREFEIARAVAAKYEEQQRMRAQSAAPLMDALEQQASVPEESLRLDAADVFRHCMSGSVHEVRRFLEQGGYADTVYKSAYGWDVGPDYRHTKPNDGTTVLNYVATWSDVIGEAAPQLVDLLLKHGADLQRDDGLDQWFTPLHNAVANGAQAVIKVLLDAQPQAINLTTGDGRTPLHVLALCDDPTDRLASLGLLLQYNTELNFEEPFEGNTPLHVMAREGHSEVVIRLLEAGASKGAINHAGRTPLQEAQHFLRVLEHAGDRSVTRRSKISETITIMEIDGLAVD